MSKKHKRKTRKIHKYAAESSGAGIGYQDFINSWEARIKLVKSMNLMDDTFFAAVMEDTEACTYVLRVITGIKSLVVRSCRVQYHIRNLSSHSVTLDVIAEDDDGRIYNIEVQKRDDDYHPKRIRYYQANVDVSFLKKGCSYEKLPESYFIFITSFDPFGLNDNYYEIEHKVKGHSAEVSNGVHEIYLNTKVVNNSELSDLLQYFRNTDAESEKFGALSDKVRFYKKNEKGGVVMCDKIQRLIDESNAEKDRIIEEQRVALERQRAEAEKQRAENERQRAEIAMLKAQVAMQS